MMFHPDPEDLEMYGIGPFTLASNLWGPSRSYLRISLRNHYRAIGYWRGDVAMEALPVCLNPTSGHEWSQIAGGNEPLSNEPCHCYDCKSSTSERL